MFVLQKRDQGRRASRTAEFMALFRALETSRPAGERLFADPLARNFLRPSLRVAVCMARLPMLGALIEWFIDRRWPGARTSGVARTRLIDGEIAAALQQGIGQVVLLGAGFDARAYRLAGIGRSRVFEVDHAATLDVKREVLRTHARQTTGHVRFVEVDFERDDLRESLVSAGFRTDVPAFFLWEGVTNYLTADAVDATLGSVASLSATGSRLLFTYVHRAVIDAATASSNMHRLFATLQGVGEPWTFGFDPDELPGFLASRGFSLSMDQSACEYRARYLGTRGAGYEFYRAALAQRVATTACAGDGESHDHA